MIPSYNIPPATHNPIVYHRSPNSVQLARWSLIPFWAWNPKIAYSTINARAEDIAEKPTYHKLIRSQRCLVPADGFYEWERLTLEDKEEKFPWYISLKERALFAFAGLWDVWKDAEGVEILTYSIITTIPNELIQDLHSRMPVILHQTDEEAWLDSETPLSTVLDLLKPYPPTEMISYPVSSRVNSTPK
jgi:putative SOS response-associated peptidase YedK